MNEIELNRLQNEVNKKPIPDFDNLSTSDMHELIYSPFSSRSIIQFKKGIPNLKLKEIGFFKLCEYLLKTIDREGDVQLTKWNNLNTKFVTEIHKLKFTDEEVLVLKERKVYRQDDILSLQNAVIILNKILKLVKIRKNKMSLTKKGQVLLKRNNHEEILKLIFETYGLNFNWAYHDAYSDSNRIQATFGYILYLLLKYGKEERSANFYAIKIKLAFPEILQEFNSDWSTPEGQLKSCLSVRCFERFLNWFNFITVRKEYGKNRIDDTFIKNNLLAEVLRIEKPRYVNIKGKFYA